MPKVSIIVPAFNAAPTLQQTLESLLNQTYRDFEVVLVDDGSTDATRRLAEAHCADPRMRVVRQSNLGAAGARNTGIAMARGRYIGFCDADDMWHPQKLATHVAHLDTNADVGVSYSATTLIDEDNRPLGTVERPRLLDISVEHLFRHNPVGTVSSVVARREALEDLSYRPYSEKHRDWIFDETLRAFEDFECWLRLALTTSWKIEGVHGLLTRQRVNVAALGTGIDRQMAGWDRMVAALRPAAPAFFTQHEPAARAHQMHILSYIGATPTQADPHADVLMGDAQMPPLPDAPEEMCDQTPASLAAMMLDAIGAGGVTRMSRGAPASRI